MKPMKTMMSAGLAAALAVAGIAAVPAVAQADGVRADGSFDVAQNYHRGNGWQRGPGWNNGPRHPGWRGPGYYPRPGYRGNYYYNNYNSALAAGVFGLAAGAIIGGAVANNNQQRYANDYIAYCSQRYRSFNAATGTYTGYDGRQYRCVAPQ
ncbi:BA14K-like protein [Kaistia soli DSM 19436]|uniref:Lectin-like protein BA14k n=2 Tax=Kaistia TaxID=166953 RepID=A0A1M5ACI3_9HYPH|nr:BA14K-like protein [Kaistia soli DSM 19436]